LSFPVNKRSRHFISCVSNIQYYCLK
jgi:hypothetical protein